MRTIEQAREVAVATLAASGFREAGLVLIDARTEHFEAGWVYYYQSARHMETRELQDMLAGNAPLFVPRNGEMPQFISYHRPAAESVDAFLCCGNANGQANAEVELLGWRPGALKGPAIDAIRECSSLGLGAAKDAVDGCLSGSAARVQTTSVAAARALVSMLAQLGFAARLTYGG